VNSVKRELSEIPGMEDYRFYYIDMEGDIYSHKYIKPRKLRTFKHNGPKPYLMVNLSNGKGKLKSFYVGRLVALAFLPNHTDSWGIRYKNGNIQDNSLSNIEWVGELTQENIEWVYSLDDQSGCYISANMLQLTDETVQLISKIKQNYKEWASTWGKILSDRRIERRKKLGKEEQRNI
jgi:hypothetical protein